MEPTWPALAGQAAHLDAVRRRHLPTNTRGPRVKRLLPLGLLAILLLLGLLVILPPRPHAAWDHSPDAVIVEMDTTGNFYISDNHIPLFRLWGNGTVLWVRDNGPLQVLRGTLTTTQTAALIDDIIDNGFFRNMFAWLSP